MPELLTSYTISPSNDSTLAIEVSKTGLMRRKTHILFFNKFEGEMSFAEKDPGAFKITLTIDANSAECRDAGWNEKKRGAVAEFARKNVLAANIHPEIRFASNSIRPKPLRGFVVEGVLQLRDVARVVKVSAVLSPMRKDCLQIDGDVTLRLSDFGLPKPSAMFGLMRTKDEALIRLLLWAIPRAEIIEPTV